jgi:hypothetical protein
MDDTNYIRGRMNALLNDRIAHGAGMEGYGEGRVRRRRRDSKCEYYRRKNPKYWETPKGRCISYETHIRNYRRRKARGKGEGLLLDEYDYATPYGGMRCGGCGCCSQCGYGEGVLVGGTTRRRKDSKCKIYEQKNPKYWKTPKGRCISYETHIRNFRKKKETKKPKNPWLDFLRRFRKAYKTQLEGLPAGEVMRLASSEYRRYGMTPPEMVNVNPRQLYEGYSG